MKPIHHEIIQEIYRAFEKLGAKPGYLAAVGSWGDTLEDEDVLSMLQAMNEGREENGFPA